MKRKEMEEEEDTKFHVKIRTKMNYFKKQCKDYSIIIFEELFREVITLNPTLNTFIPKVILFFDEMGTKLVCEKVYKNEKQYTYELKEALTVCGIGVRIFSELTKTGVGDSTTEREYCIKNYLKSGDKSFLNILENEVVKNCFSFVFGGEYRTIKKIEWKCPLDTEYLNALKGDEKFDVLEKLLNMPEIFQLLMEIRENPHGLDCITFNVEPGKKDVVTIHIRDPEKVKLGVWSLYILLLTISTAELRLLYNMRFTEFFL